MSASFCNLIIGGRLTRDPVLRYTPSNTAVCEFGMAWDEGYGDNKKSNFIDVTAFGKTAETINEHLQKGRPVIVAGRLSFEQWDDKNGGGKRSKLKMIADRIHFNDPPRQQGDAPRQPQQRQQQRPQSQRPQRPADDAPPESPYTEGEQHFADEDIPF